MTARAHVPGDHFVPWSGEVAAGWRMKPISTVAEVNREALNDSTPGDRAIRYIDIGSVDALGRVNNVADYTFDTAPSRARRIVRDGDTIISTVRTYLRAVAYMDRPAPQTICSTGFAVLSPGRELHPKFLFYWVLSTNNVDEVCARSTGVSYPALNPSEIGHLPVAIPPLATQRRIAEFLDRELARTDAIISAKETLVSTLALRHRIRVTDAVQGGLDPAAPRRDTGDLRLGSIPRHWRVLRGKFVMTPFGGYAPEAVEETTDGIVYYKVDDLNDGDGLRLGPAQRVVSPIGLRVLQPDAILIPKRGAAIFTNKVRVVSTPCVFDTNVMGLKVEPPHDVEFVAQALWARGLRDVADVSTVPQINNKHVRELLFPIPPPDEQTRIAKAINEWRGALDRATAAITTQIERLNDYRRAIITGAVTGQTRVDSSQEAA